VDQTQQKPEKPSKLEIAGEMYKFAFAVKKQKFAQQFLDLSDDELNRKTAVYLRDLKK